MQRIVDLSMPVADHFRWPVERHLKGDFGKGDQFQVTWIGWTVHGFTHMDSARHISHDGFTTDEIALDRVIGPAAVIDISDVGENQEIPADLLVARGAAVQPDDIIILGAFWDRRRSIHTPEFWTDAPYLGRQACEWLLDRRPKAVGFDFPQDRPIRNLLKGQVDPIEDYVSHDVLLRNGVILIEYLCNVASIGADRAVVHALPIRIPHADGAPARVIATVEDSGA
jgi:kynurenine formamidase